MDDIYLETAYTLGAKPWQAIMRVLVPAAWPGIFEACRVIYGVGWTYVILAELINAKYGLGYLITIAYKRGNIDQAYALVLVILLLGIAHQRSIPPGQQAALRLEGGMSGYVQALPVGCRTARMFISRFPYPGTASQRPALEDISLRIGDVPGRGSAA